MIPLGSWPCISSKPLLSAWLVAAQCCMWSIGLCAAEIHIAFGPGIGLDYPVVAVNAGDTVKWTLINSWNEAEVVASYTGAWQNQWLTNVGDHFACTFTNAGFYPYHAGRCYGTVTVEAWTNRPPAITVDSPVEGMFIALGDSQVRGLASLADGETNVLAVSFALGTNVLASVSNAPYSLSWQYTNKGSFALTATLVRKDGSSVTSAPVHIVVDEEGSRAYFAQRLPGGEMLMYYTASPGVRGEYMVYKNDLNEAQWRDLAVLRFPPVFVDTNTVGVSSRFYRVWAAELPPP